MGLFILTSQGAKQTRWHNLRALLLGTLLQVCCDISPLQGEGSIPCPRGCLPGEIPKRVQTPDFGSQALSPSTPTLQFTLPSYLLDFLCEVLGNDATFLLLLFMFAWKGEECHMSPSKSLWTSTVQDSGLDSTLGPTPPSLCDLGLDLEAAGI